MKYIIIAGCLLAITSCASKQMIPGSEKMLLSSNPAAKECQFLGEVSGSQGNIWTADVTSDKNMMQGARNEIRNNAFNIGANYVVIQNQSQSNNTSGVGGTYNSTIFGNAYKCPSN